MIKDLEEEEEINEVLYVDPYMYEPDAKGHQKCGA